ncbi:MAG TPA: hypothetical protein VF658_01080 [Pyrinomonadaceae bacterium]|jgi:hypothetical protein
MKRVLIYVLVVALAFVVGLYVYLAFSSQPGRFWRKLNEAQVTREGQLLPDARVYRQPDGKVLLDVGEGSRWYCYFPEVLDIGSCQPITYVSFPGYIYAFNWKEKATDYPCVIMGLVKTGVKADVLSLEHSIEFTSTEQERLLVSW